MTAQQACLYQEQNRGPAAEREQTILDLMPTVRYMAMRVHERLPPSILFEDLVSAGIVGLISAVDHFDPSYNVKLSTFASYRIRGAIMDSIRSLDGIAQHHRKTVKEIQAAIVTLEQRLQRSPTEEEIAAELDLSLVEYQETLLQTRSVTIGSLDAAPANTDNITFLSYFADKEADQPHHLLEKSELKRLLAEGVGRLPETERLVLSLYFVEEMNLAEVGKILNLSGSRVCQLKSQAVLRLRAYLERRWPARGGRASHHDRTQKRTQPEHA